MSDLPAAVDRDQSVVDVQRPEQRPYVFGDLLSIEITRERSMDVVQVAAFDNQHGPDVFFALKEVPAIGGFRAQETRQIEGVIRVGKDEKIFFRSAHL